jgi:hypothetical protein
MKVLARPDTLYLFSHVLFQPSVASDINEAINRCMNPERKNWIQRIENYLAECDPFTANELRNRPWHELIQHVRDSLSNPLGDEQFPEMPAISVEVKGRHFALVPWSPRRGCNFMLQAADQTIHGNLKLSSPQCPNLYLEIGSAPFWETQDWREFLLNWFSWLKSIATNVTTFKVSRLDCAFHTQSIQSEDLDRQNFVCKATTHSKTTKSWILDQIERAHMADEYAREAGMPAEQMPKLIEKLNLENEMYFTDWFKGVSPQMITFGTRGRLYARLYNKSKEIQKSKTKRALFTGVWNNHGFNPNKDVINVEFELCRSWFGSRELVDAQNRVIIIDTLQDLLKHFSTLCAFLVGSSDTEKNKGWLRMIAPNTATRRERCSSATAWELIRKCSEHLPYLRSADRQHARIKITQAHLVRQSVKYFAQLDAICGREPQEDYNLAKGMEILAEAITQNSPYTEYEMREIYRTERAKAQSVNFPVISKQSTEAFAS